MRSISAGTGAAAGLQAAPHVGDNVIVGFEHDDHRRPLVLGGIWTQDASPPLSDAPMDRTWRDVNGAHLTMEHESNTLTLAGFCTGT